MSVLIGFHRNSIENGKKSVTNGFFYNEDNVGFLLEDNSFISYVNDDKKTVSNIILQWFVRQKATEEVMR